MRIGSQAIVMTVSFVGVFAFLLWLFNVVFVQPNGFWMTVLFGVLSGWASLFITGAARVN